ncbi:cupredoxin domain-containing protein [Candidatus Nitrosocosmicus franklandus]|uniref:Amicyanin n=1 Tax=Candidatus Nitrosocosmicus franklandianus TaxID=1798806 RepID=A0A484ICM0_9ARCH|nr:cupredoxin domain-containing protein [Candidatus Nitrosocosmicus franklandus]VFJ14556.1 Amicyanin [Candidatus Nitrosocosmicus franklandus]
MTTHDETHITRTSPTRFMKGLIIIIIPLIFLGYITIAYWDFTASIPPPVSAPPPAAPSPATPDSSPTSAESTGASTTPAAGSGTAISIPVGASTQGNPSYAPDSITVSKGDIITVTNDDAQPHTLTSGSGPQDPNSAKLFDTGILMSGDSAEVDTTTLEPGDYQYYCTVHPFMTGSLTVQ